MCCCSRAVEPFVRSEGQNSDKELVDHADLPRQSGGTARPASLITCDRDTLKKKQGATCATEQLALYTTGPAATGRAQDPSLLLPGMGAHGRENTFWPHQVVQVVACHWPATFVVAHRCMGKCITGYFHVLKYGVLKA
jgi:hypothetical protein